MQRIVYVRERGKKLQYFFAAFVVTALCLVGALRHRQGSKCKNGGENGQCKLSTDCPEAVESLNKTRSHNLTRCGFDGSTEIVCCPTEKPSLTTNFPISTLDPEPRDNFFSLSCATAYSTYKKKDELSLGIVHLFGAQIADGNEFPHMAALGFDHPEDRDIKFDCGGTLISELHVLTAAHCFNRNNILVIVRIGTNNVPLSLKTVDPKFDYNVSNHVTHPKYNWKTSANDIAIIKLQKRVKYDGAFILPACLYDKADEPLEMIVTGWGVTDLFGVRSVNLLKATLNPFPLEECNITYVKRLSKILKNTQLCAIDKNTNSHACPGDSGGPLQVPFLKSGFRYSIVGITSYGLGCGSRYSGVFTRVFPFIDWIESEVWLPERE